MADVRLIRSTTELEGTCYFEFLPGRYDQKCWNEGSVFLSEEAFDLIEPIFLRRVPEFDHYAFVEINRSRWSLIVGDLEVLTERLATVNGVDELRDLVRVTNAFDEHDLRTAFVEYKRLIRQMLTDLAAWLRGQASRHEIISVLGM